MMTRLMKTIVMVSALLLAILLLFGIQSGWMLGLRVVLIMTIPAIIVAGATALLADRRWLVFLPAAIMFAIAGFLSAYYVVAGDRYEIAALAFIIFAVLAAALGVMSAILAWWLRTRAASPTPRGRQRRKG